MSIQFEWHADAEELTSEPPPPPPSRRRSRRFLLSLSLLLGLIGTLVVGMLYQRQRQQHAIAADLEPIVRLELQALIEGDEELFLNQQMEISSWPVYQKRRFDLYRQMHRFLLPPAVVPYTYTGRILKVWGEPQYAWAAVEVMMDGQPHQEIRHYWNTPEGWRHAPLTDKALGARRERTVGSIRLRYWEVDERPARYLANDLRAWLATLMPPLGLETTAPLTIELRPDPLGTRAYTWTADRSRLTIVSPSLLPLQRDGRPAQVYRQALAYHVTGWLINQAVGIATPQDLAPEVRGLWGDLLAWAMIRLDLNPPLSTTREPVLEQVVQRHGLGAVARLVQAMGEAQTVIEVFQQANLSEPDPPALFTLLLEAQQQAIAQGDRKAYRALLDPEADATWRADQVSSFTWTPGSLTDVTGLNAYFSEAAIYRYNPLSHPRGVTVTFQRDRAWVEAEGMPLASQTRVVFFHRADGRWLYTSPDPSYLGGLREVKAPYIVLQYYEADADVMVGLASRLSTVLQQATEDFGLSPTALTTVTIGVQTTWGWSSPNSEGLSYTSPSLSGVDPEMSLTYGLVSQVAFRRLDVENLRGSRSYSSPGQMMILQGLISWEAQHLLVDHPFRWSRADLSSLSLRPLAEAWEGGRGSDAFSPDLSLTGYTLVAFLVEEQGSRAVGKMLDALATAESLDDWLQAVSGQGLDEVEPTWQAWLRRQAGSPSSPSSPSGP